MAAPLPTEVILRRVLRFAASCAFCGPGAVDGAAECRTDPNRRQRRLIRTSNFGGSNAHQEIFLTVPAKHLAF